MLENLKEKINKILNDFGYRVFSIKQKKDYGINNIIEVLLDTHKITTDELQKIHERISFELDDIIPDNFYLEIGSLGAEMPIKTKKELEKAVGSYIYLVTPQYRGNAELLSFEKDLLTLEIKEKNIKKIIKIKWENASQMRYAVRM